MKSRTSFCNRTLIKKDIIRFAPVWVLYTIFSLLVAFSFLNGKPGASNVTELNSLSLMYAIVNLFYGFITAQQLFGDLFKSRLCNALHAMPVNRTHRFCSHAISGLLFSLVPNLLVTFVIMPTLREFWYAAFLWLASTSLSYVFFFSVSVLSMMLTGNRFAAGAVYAIINFISYVVYWFINQVFLPVMPGIVLEDSIFFLFCPVAVLSTSADLLGFKFGDGVMHPVLKDGWISFLIFGAVGIAIGFCALLLYRRRALEKAGEFIAVKPLEPVFLITYTLCAGAFLALFSFIDEQLVPMFLAIGLIIGFFTGRMLLERTVRVFRKQNFLVLAALLLIAEGAVGLAKLDILGIVHYVPDAEDIAFVDFTSSNRLYYGVELNTPSEIETVVQAHEAILDHLDEEDRYQAAVTFVYHLNNGTVVRRKYRIYSETAYDAVQKVENLPKAQLGFTDPVQAAKEISIIYAQNVNDGITEKIFNPSHIAQLLEALYQDQIDGNIYPNGAKYDCLYTIEYSLTSYTLCVGKDSVHTLAWLEDYFAALENSCADAISGEAINLTTAAYTYIQGVLVEVPWTNDGANCAYDYIFHIQGTEFLYHSECGTFCETVEKQCFTVSDDQQAQINRYLGIQAQ